MAGVTKATAIASPGAGPAFFALGDGVLWTWSTDATAAVPPSIPGRALNAGNLVQLDARDGLTCAVARDGTVPCWGQFGVPGQKPQERSPTPEDPVRLFGIDDAAEVTVTGRRGCIRRIDGTVGCWNDADPPLRLTPLPSVQGAVHVALGDDSGMAIVANGQVVGWGSNLHGELCLGLHRGSDEAIDVPALTGAVEVHLAGARSCAVAKDHRVVCCGGPDEASMSPRPIAGLDSVRSVAIDSDGGCAIHLDATVSCWGVWSSRDDGAPALVLEPDAPRAE